MYQVIIVIHILLGLSIIGLILMQQGKGADAGATFGGGASGSVFGAQGAASFLSRTTAILASLFFATSLGLTWLGGNKTMADIDFMGSPSTEKEVPDMGAGIPDIKNDIVKPNAAVVPPEEKATVPVSPPVNSLPAATPNASSEKVAPPAPVESNPEDNDKVVEEKESELKSAQPEKMPAKKK